MQGFDFSRRQYVCCGKEAKLLVVNPSLTFETRTNWFCLERKDSPELWSIAEHILRIQSSGCVDILTTARHSG